METKNIIELESYVENEKVKNPKIKIRIYELCIDTIPINFNLITDYLGLILCIYLTYTADDYRNLLLILWLLILLKTWRDFRFVNYVIIDLKEKKIKVISKNLIKRVFTGIINYSFEEVDHFFHDKINLFNRAVPRYTISLRTKSGDAIEITDFSEQKHAVSITAYLNLILNKK